MVGKKGTPSLPVASRSKPQMSRAERAGKKGTPSLPVNAQWIALLEDGQDLEVLTR
jgi:hypothetical protein